jgi:hypothetical protein
MDHIPNAVFGSLHHTGPGSLGFIDTIVMFTVAGTMLYGGFWVLIKLGDAVRWIREQVERRQAAGR